ncbi:hypothetical protein ABPG77_011413 [Micractinium sp. CCAP 211/92]
MGNCVSSDVIVDPGLDPEMTPQCTICGEGSAAPLRRLPAEEREGWAAVGGQPVHRRCAVARKLEEARLEKERASYRRIRKEVYALPREALHASQGSELHRIGSGREWSASDSFRRPYVPASPLARLSTQQQQQQLELLEQAVEQQAARQAAEQESAEGQPDAQGMQPQVAPQPSPEHLLPSKGGDSHPSPQDVLPAGEYSHDSLALSSRSSSGAAAHPALLRQTSPVRHAALMETKSIRRRSLQRPSFDGAAMQADPDGGDGGKAWRAQCRAAAEEARRREERVRAMCDQNDF